MFLSTPTKAFIRFAGQARAGRACLRIAPALIAVIVLGSAGVASPRAVRAATALPAWPTYHHDFARRGLDPTTGFQYESVIRGWTAGVDEAIYTEPLLAGNSAFVATQNNTVYSIDASSGAVNWTNHLGSPVAGSQLCK